MKDRPALWDQASPQGDKYYTPEIDTTSPPRPSTVPDPVWRSADQSYLNSMNVSEYYTDKKKDALLLFYFGERIPVAIPIAGQNAYYLSCDRPHEWKYKWVDRSRGKDWSTSISQMKSLCTKLTCVGCCLSFYSGVKSFGTSGLQLQLKK